MAKNRTVWIVGGVLVLVIAIGAMVAGGGKKKKKTTAASPPVSARAVVLPANRSRTVVIPPCNTPVRSTARNAAAGRPTPGATTATLPQASGVHTLFVPHCQPTRTGSTDLAGEIPSAAFILGDRKRLTKNRDGKLLAEGVAAGSQLILPDGSNASTIVVPPCRKKAEENERDVVLRGGSDPAVGPVC